MVVPTLNAASLIDACLGSIVGQTYRNIELIVVDRHSTDGTAERARVYTSNVFDYGPSHSAGHVFATPLQQNYGATKASGAYIYCVDADMVLPPNALEECIRAAKKLSADALVVPERSFGIGFWAEVKAAERVGYLGDELVEAPRFIRAEVWRALEGIDAEMGGVYDWDLRNRLQANGWSVGRASCEVLHNEGRLSPQDELSGRSAPYVHSWPVHHESCRVQRGWARTNQGSFDSAITRDQRSAPHNRHKRDCEAHVDEQACTHHWRRWLHWLAPN